MTGAHPRTTTRPVVGPPVLTMADRAHLAEALSWAYNDEREAWDKLRRKVTRPAGRRVVAGRRRRPRP